MRTLFNTCYADPWIKVAKRLQENKIVNPVYWIGYYHDNSEEDVPLLFPEIVYQSRWDAWKGIFPGLIEKEYVNYNLDPDYLKSISCYEMQAITLMDRMDPNRHSFPFAERQRLFRNMLRKWIASIKLYNLELIIADRIPHRSYDYPLYLISKHTGVKYLFLLPTSLKYRSLACQDLNNINQQIENEYKYYCQRNKGLDLDAIRGYVESDILEKYDICKMNYDQAIPTYMTQHQKRQKRNSNIFKLGVNFAWEFLNLKKNKEIHHRRNRGFLYDFMDVHPYAKKPNKSIEDSKYNALEYGLTTYMAIRYKKLLKSTYEKKAQRLDLDKPYVCFFMHYQPEATSCPAGDIYVDQYLAIEQLASVIPIGWNLYVKEHTSQFNIIGEGQKSRFEHLYSDLEKINNVKLISLEENSFELIDNAEAVATLTGTVGWEAVVRGKPVIVFGLTWYEDCYGVLKVRESKDLDSIKGFIDAYQPNENAVFNYLLAIQRNAPQTYSYMAKGKKDINENDCINSITKQIIDIL